MSFQTWAADWALRAAMLPSSGRIETPDSKNLGHSSHAEQTGQTGIGLAPHTAWLRRTVPPTIVVTGLMIRGTTRRTARRRSVSRRLRRMRNRTRRMR